MALCKSASLILPVASGSQQPDPPLRGSRWKPYIGIFQFHGSGINIELTVNQLFHMVLPPKYDYYGSNVSVGVLAVSLTVWNPRIPIWKRPAWIPPAFLPAVPA